MICPSKKCTLQGQNQPLTEFVSDWNGARTMTCKTCREKGRRYCHRSYHGLSNPRRGNDAARPVEVLEPGNAPRFNFEWEKGKHQEWLRGLAQEVIRQ